jgi:hypothetical protein
VLAQAAIAHAQFESIHPFTDGNGRIGRAVINTVLRRRGTTGRVIVPIASALVAHRDRYFDLSTSTAPATSAARVGVQQRDTHRRDRGSGDGRPGRRVTRPLA